MLKFDDRFARQDRCEPPPEFPLASPCSNIVHHLSGLSARALAPRPLAASVLRGPVLRRHAGDGSHPFCLSCATGVRVCPSTRARAQLLGPCFKTGRTECREPRGLDPARRRGTGRDDARRERGIKLFRQFARAARTPPASTRSAGAECAAGAPRPRGQRRAPGL